MSMDAWKGSEENLHMALIHLSICTCSARCSSPSSSHTWRRVASWLRCVSSRRLRGMWYSRRMNSFGYAGYGDLEDDLIWRSAAQGDKERGCLKGQFVVWLADACPLRSETWRVAAFFRTTSCDCDKQCSVMGNKVNE